MYMMQINRLKLEIRAFKGDFDSNKIKELGFDIPFYKGLNIIKGENSSGKSTIISCLFYALCLEEILGSKYNKSLNKALKKQLTVRGQTYTVITSYVHIEIENSRGEIYTLRRGIHYESNNTSNKFLIKCFEGKMGLNNRAKDLFIHRKRNHESELGYYKWLSLFLGIETPTVLNRDGDDIKLYWQTVFPALLIEQVKGWSDFLASLPYFGIQNNKHRTIEFLLNLVALTNELAKEKLEKDNKEIKKNWKNTINKISLLAVSNEGVVSNLTEEPLSDIKALDEVIFSIYPERDLSKIEEQGDPVEIEEFILALQGEHNELIKKPKYANINKQRLSAILSVREEEYENYTNAYEEFSETFNIQKKQIASYEKFLKELEEEIEANKDIKYLTTKDSKVNELKKCPTCNQDLESLIPVKQINFDLKSIEGNLKYLQSQEKLLKSSIGNLEEIIEEKRIINASFIKEMSDLRFKISQIKSELIDPNMMPSRTQLYERIKLEVKIKNLVEAEDKFFLLKNELSDLAQKFALNKAKLASLLENEGKDNLKLNKLEEDFKQLLNKFYYTSNDIKSISIQKKLPFKYFPVIKYNQGEIQKIQLGSSASDFIRSIWAYTISLLKNSENHPGIILFDEPSQHSMNSRSLKGLFRVLSELKDYQVIVAASTDKREKTEDDQPYSLDSILEGIEYNQYRIIEKSITELN